MNLAASVTRLLSERLGLSPDLLSFVAVERALNIVLGGAGPKNRTERIAQLLQGQGEEWETLVDEIIVPETWFFRDSEPFHFLASYLKEKWRPANPTGSFQALCIPCASGEEPYSVAMTLLDAGLEAGRIWIDAGDVSEGALAKARRAVYEKNSFREKSGHLGRKYFLPCSEGQQVQEEVVALVHFEKANLLDLSVYRQHAPYHAVFCRNALIYLDEIARCRVITGLRDLLDEDGLLFTGHSELMRFLEAGFQPVQHPQSFACRKVAPGLQQAPWGSPTATDVSRERRRGAGPCAPTPQPAGRTVTGVGATMPQARKLRQRATANARKPRSTPQVPASLPGIKEAERLADRGELEAAAEICRHLLAAGTQDSEVYSLLGVISESTGKLETAADLFRKALFLDPHHYQSLVHMSLLCERRGDIDGSRLYRARAEKVFSQQEGNREVQGHPVSG
jgi:chemotaxis protein methyltransferase WspC